MPVQLRHSPSDQQFHHAPITGQGGGTKRSASHSKLASSLSLLLTKLTEGIYGSLSLFLQTTDEVPGGHQTVLCMSHLALKQGWHHLSPANE